VENCDQVNKIKPKIIPNITREEILESIREIGEYLNTKKFPGSCDLYSYGGNKEGGHKLCRLQKSDYCRFLSYGISNIYTFDTELSDLGCEGAGLDPTVNHLSKLTDNVYFMQIGAPMLEKTDPRWLVYSPIRMMEFMGYKKLTVLKMDCEGCEYAIAKFLEEEDMDFLSKVDQFSLELHVTTKWIQTDEHLTNLGKLFYYLKKAGFKMMTGSVDSCSWSDEVIPCRDEFQQLNYPCGNGHSCHNMLFSRVHWQ